MDDLSKLIQKNGIKKNWALLIKLFQKQLDIFWISTSKNPSRRYSPRKLGISNGYVLDSKEGSVTTCCITDVLFNVSVAEK
jgi:hypothetical protein